MNLKRYLARSDSRENNVSVSVLKRNDILWEIPDNLKENSFNEPKRHVPHLFLHRFCNDFCTFCPEP
jgi:hypothetical protein